MNDCSSCNEEVSLDALVSKCLWSIANICGRMLLIMRNAGLQINRFIYCGYNSRKTYYWFGFVAILVFSIWVSKCFECCRDGLAVENNCFLCRRLEFSFYNQCLETEKSLIALHPEHKTLCLTSVGINTNVHILTNRNIKAAKATAWKKKKNS